MTLKKAQEEITININLARNDRIDLKIKVEELSSRLARVENA